VELLLRLNPKQKLQAMSGRAFLQDRESLRSSKKAKRVKESLPRKRKTNNKTNLEHGTVNIPKKIY
jgi:hypothetical protein